MKTMFVLAALAVTGWTLPAGISAQTTVDGDAVERIEQARLLSQQAWILANQDGSFAEAALYLRKASRLRAGDAEAVGYLLNAGRFHYYAHRPMQAVSALKDAGEAALRQGDPVTAEQAFLDAAWVAASAGDVVTARNLLSRTDPLRWHVVTEAGVALSR